MNEHSSSSKHQIPNNHQTPKSKTELCEFIFGLLEFGISLEFGVWNLGFSDLAIVGNNSKMVVMPAVATRSLIQREIGDDRVCLLTFDRPESGANIFDAATMSELSEHVDAIERDNSVRGLIITSAKRSIFIAGADLKTLLKQAQTGELRDFIAKGQRVFNRIAGLKIPSVAAVHGACAGGGYEITLACDWRVASDDPATRIGLPETTLGLIPAWGGSTRLPRLIGEDNAAEVILKGKLYSASEALKIGLVDEVASREQLLDAARRLIGKGKRPAAKMSPAPISDRTEPECFLSPATFLQQDVFLCRSNVLLQK